MGNHTATSDLPSHRLDVSLAELSVGLAVAACAAVILVAYVVDMAGWPIDPQPVGVLVALAALLGVWAARQWGPPVRLIVRWDELAGLALILVGLPVYLYWLAGSTWLPPTVSGDAPHHMLLINFIQNHASLPHDPDLWRYLGEFATYTPGSHILAALVGRVLGVASLYTIEPMLTCLAAVRVAVFYLIALRLLGQERRRALLALAATILLLSAYEYVINSFLFYFFYAQVVSELFALAMLWALVAWNDRPWFGLLGFFSLCGIAVWLTWPLSLPAPILALAGLLLLRDDLPLRRRALSIGLTLLPIAAVVVVYTIGRTKGLSLLGAEGSVATPSVELFGWPLLLIALVGMAISLRRQAVRPVWLFTAALALQIVALAALDMLHHVETYYQAYKMFYLLVYPLGLFAAVGLAGLWQAVAQRWPRAGIPLAAALPLAALALAVWNGLPWQPLLKIPENTTFTEPLYAAATWSRQNLPAGCVDYLVPFWATAYWLQLELGNPRADARTDEIIHHYDDRLNSPDRWTRPRGLPYAIVADMQSVPEDIRSHFKVLYENGPTAVVYRTGECDEDVVPLQDHPLAPRTGTLAARLDEVLGTHLAVY